MSRRLLDYLAADVELEEIDIVVGVLASPELQQIRSTLKRMSQVMADRRPLMFDSNRDVLINYGLPDHLIDWILE